GHDAQPFLVLVLGEKASAPAVAQTLEILSVAAMLLATYELSSTVVMLGAGSAWSCALPIMAGTIVNLTISIVGAPEYGIVAIAGGTAIGNGVTCGLMWWSAARLLRWPPLRVLRTLTAPALVAA